MSYRGFDLEQKTLMVGWQIAITRDGKFVRNGSVTKELAAAMDEAEKYVDCVLAEADDAAPGARS